MFAVMHLQYSSPARVALIPGSSSCLGTAGSFSKDGETISMPHKRTFLAEVLVSNCARPYLWEGRVSLTCTCCVQKLKSVWRPAVAILLLTRNITSKMSSQARYLPLLPKFQVGSASLMPHTRPEADISCHCRLTNLSTSTRWSTPAPSPTSARSES